MASVLPRTRPIWTKIRLRPSCDLRILLSSPRNTRPLTIPAFSIDSDRSRTILDRPLLIERPRPGIVGLTLNRPRSLNALNAELVDALLAQVHKLTEDPETRAIVLMGQGEEAFCSGQDLKQTLTEVGPQHEEYEEQLRKALEKLQSITKGLVGSDVFVVSAVHGWAVGGGAELALAADYVLGSETVKFSFPEVKLGQIATGGITGRLSRMVGLMRAKEMLLTGRTVGSEEAYRIGLLSEVVQTHNRSEILKERAFELAIQMSEYSATAIAETKRLVEEGTRGMDMEEHLGKEVDSAVKCMASEEGRKIYEKFGEKKRAPLRTIAAYNTQAPIRKTAIPVGSGSGIITPTTVNDDEQPRIRFSGPMGSYSQKRTFLTKQ